MDSNKICIVTCGIGAWYPLGVVRMERSLIYHGYAGQFYKWIDTYPSGCPEHSLNPYAFKVYAIEFARKKGYTHILWLDASLWAVKNPMPIFDIINDNGLYFFRTGYNLAQSCNDAILKYSGITRDEAERMPEFATGAIGLNFEREDVHEIFKMWKQYMKKGMFKGSREHGGQSEDPRFLFHRQDQSAMSIVLNKFWNEEIPQSDLIQYYNQNESNAIFFIQGM